MVSPLWKACSDGDLQKVLEFLNEPSSVDIELKDHTGVTPLIEAVRNGHIEIVKVLLEKGADPVNASSQGLPESYTAEPAILELLQNAPRKELSNGFLGQQPVFANGAPEDSDKVFYPQPPHDTYTYYPTINPSLSTVNEPGVYYPPMPPADGVSANGMGNLPPPDVARLIPCRYFPACRYGAQCMFAHPQTNYYQGPMPSVQYPPYDPMAHQYVPQYYPSPPPFQQPHNMSPMSPPPGPPVMHARTPSEVVSPSLGHFSPTTAPPGAVPYGPMSPPVYPHPSQVPMGMSPMPALSQQQPHPAHPPPVPQSHPNLYNASASTVPPFALHQDAPGGPYPIAVPPPNHNYPDTNIIRSPENPQVENYNTHPNHRDGGNNHRRGTGRRPSFNSRKPPCLFFPAGRCKNGDDCRFPHVIPENGASPHNSSFPATRGGAPRPRPHVNGANGHGPLEAKFANMSVRDETSRQKNGVEGSSRSHSSDAGPHPKLHQGKHVNGVTNGHSQNKKASVSRHQQRVPNADEFPVLAGSTTPPNRVGTNGFNGPTAAQVLRAPAPVRNDGSKESSTRGTTPDPARGVAPKDATTDGSEGVHEEVVPVQEQPIINTVPKHPVMSFAAAAAATSSPSDISKEVSVSA